MLKLSRVPYPLLRVGYFTLATLNLGFRYRIQLLGEISNRRWRESLNRPPPVRHIFCSGLDD